MGLHKDDREFRHPGVSYLDYKQVEMDRVLTGFLPRLWWQGWPSVVIGAKDLTVDDFVDTFLEHPDLFVGFDRDTTHRWLETHLLDLVNRGKPGQAVAGPRPLHGFTYRFRVAKRTRPYGADEQLYWMIHHAADRQGVRTLDRLKTFFFAGVDARTGELTTADPIDVETQALVNLWAAAKGQITDRAAVSKDRKVYPPLERAAADLLNDDINRLLYHQGLIPRSVLVEHLKILFAFHLARYHLLLMKSLPGRVAGEGGHDQVGLFLDVAGVPGSAAARLAERSARLWYGRMPAFIQATFTVRKLDDVAQHLARVGKLRKPTGGVFPVDQLLTLLGTGHRADRNRFAESRLPAVLKALEDADGEVPEHIDDLLQLRLEPFTTYIEIITACRVGFHRKYLTECLDSLLLKNRPGAMITQPRRGDRRFVFDSRLLEVLLQLALLRPDGSGGLCTTPLRVDEFLAILRDRYGLYIDELPSADWFDRPSLTDQAALRENRAAFVAKLREIGFYSDLSDAYLTQTITPRYRVAPGAGPAVGPAVGPGADPGAGPGVDLAGSAR
jgi:hypothetical protein